MRVLVAPDHIGELDAHTAARVIGGAFHHRGAEVAAVTLAPDAPRPTTSDQLVEALDGGADLVDLDALHVDDLGEGFLSSWGATPRDALDALRDRLSDRRLTVAVDGDELELPLTGLHGWAVNHSRDSGGTLAEGLAADATARAWLATLGLDDVPGSGAARGLGAVLLACGARLVDRLSLAIETTGVAASARQADLVVTACTDVDFHAKGGELVSRVVRLGEEALRPVIVLARHNFVSSRELRAAGIEAAYALHPGVDEVPVTHEALGALADRVARTWCS